MTPDPENLQGRYIDTDYGQLLHATPRKVRHGFVLLVRVIASEKPGVVFKPADWSKAIDRCEVVYAPDAELSGPL